MLTPRSVYRKWEVDGVPSSLLHDPDKVEIIQLLERMEAVSGQAVTKSTLAQLNATTPPNENYLGLVLTGTGAGYYYRAAGAWVFGRAFPGTAARLVSVAGSGNAITASTQAGVSPAAMVLLFLSPRYRNTGTVTLSVNGTAARALLAFDGEPLQADYLIAGATVPVEDDGEAYRLLFDHRWQTLAKRAEDAAEAAEADADRSENEADRSQVARIGSEAARDIAAGYASDAVSQGNVPLYSTHVGLSGAAIPAAIQSGYLWGYYANGDGGGKQIKRVDSDPGAGGVRSADRFTASGGAVPDAINGGWWVIAEGVVTPRQFGAEGDGSHDDTEQTQEWVAYQESSAASGKVLDGDYLLRDQIDFGTRAPKLEGVNSRSSSFRWAADATAEGFTCRPTSNTDMLEVTNIGFVAGLSGLGTALRMDGTLSIASGFVQPRPASKSIVKNCGFYGSATQGWATGIDLESVVGSTIEGNTAIGRGDAVNGPYISGIFVKLHGAGSPVEMTVFNNRIFYWQKAVNVANSEGVFVTHNQIVACDYGVYSDSSVPEPHLIFRRNHASIYISAVYANNTAQAFIDGNLIYQRSGRTFETRCIHLTGTGPSNVIGTNTFVKTGTAYMACIEVATPIGFIFPQMVQATTDGIVLATGSSSWRVLPGSLFANTTGVTLSDAGTNNRIPNARGGLVRTTSWAPPSGSTKVPWEGVGVVVGLSFDIASPTRLTVLTAGTYLVHGNVFVSNGATGIRGLQIKINGGDFLFAGSVREAALASGSQRLSVSSGPLSFAAGDYMELEYETSISGDSVLANVARTFLSAVLVS